MTSSSLLRAARKLISDEWLPDANVTIRQGTEHDTDVFEFLCNGPFKPIAMPDMHKGNPVQLGKSTDVVGLAKLAEKMKAAAR